MYGILTSKLISYFLKLETFSFIAGDVDCVLLLLLLLAARFRLLYIVVSMSGVWKTIESQFNVHTWPDCWLAIDYRVLSKNKKKT